MSGNYEEPGQEARPQVPQTPYPHHIEFHQHVTPYAAPVYQLNLNTNTHLQPTARPIDARRYPVNAEVFELNPTNAVPEPRTPSRHPNTGPKGRAIVVGDQRIIVVPGAIPYPRGRKSYGNNVEDLVYDWDFGSASLLQVNGINMPIRCWPRLYKNSIKEDSDFWATYSKHWSEQNVRTSRERRGSTG